MNAVQQPNVSVHFTAVKSVTKDGVIGEDGIERKCDAVVCATGKRYASNEEFQESSDRTRLTKLPM